MDDVSQLLHVIDLFYGSILNETDLECALSALAKFSGASGGYCPTYDRNNGAVLDAVAAGVDPAAQIDYLERYSQQDVRVAPAQQQPVGALFTEHMLVDRDVLEGTDLYRDFLTRHDVPHILAVWTEKSPTQLCAITLQRRAKQGRFLQSDQERLAPLVPHLIRALRVRHAMRSVRLAKSAYEQLLDRLPFGVVILNRGRALIDVSSVAESLFRRSEIISCKHGRVRAACADADARLQHSIRLAVSDDTSGDLPGATVVLHDRSRAGSLRVAVVPVRRPHPLMRHEPACMLLIFDPKSCPTPPVEAVMDALNLTRAEARLAAELCKGASMREAADSLRVSVNTCKTQLKSIYARTGCRSHVDLSKALIMSGMVQGTSLSLSPTWVKN